MGSISASISDAISQSIAFGIGSGGSSGGSSNADALILEVDTTKAGSASNTFVLPAGNTGTYDATIDWGDGTTSAITTYNDADLTHVYAASGTYDVTITGDFPHIYFNNGGDRLKLMSVKQWGAGRVFGSMERAFYGCANCTFDATDALTLPANCAIAFTNCPSFNQSVANFNTAAVTNMQLMFFRCTAFNQSLANFNTAAVQNMTSMFFECTAFKQSLATFSLASLVNATCLNNFASGTNINATGTTTNFDATLVAWADQLPLTYAQSPNFGTAKYSTATGKAGYDALDAAGWTITSGGEDV